MTTPHCDALVFLGATGDLAYKKIFPALQAMISAALARREPAQLVSCSTESGNGS